MLERSVAVAMGSLVIGWGLPVLALAGETVKPERGLAPTPPLSQLLRSEEAFVETLGSRTVRIAKGVYDAELAPGDVVRVAFGEEGREHDLGQLKARLAHLEATAAKEPGERSLRQIERLRAVVSAFEERGAKAAVTGEVLCGQVSYDYSLDSGFLVNPVIEYAWGSAQVGLELDFGPYFEYYPDHVAGVLLSAKPSNQACRFISDSDLVDDGTYSFAEASELLTCPNCLGWKVVSYVDTECVGSYRSLTRSGGVQVCP